MNAKQEEAMKVRVLAVLAGVLMLSLTAQAHHSFTSFFDLTKTVEISGVVKSVKLVNPHPEMIVEVTEPNGTKTIWTITGRATGSGILRAGWNADTVPLGMNVKVEGHPSRKDGARNIAAGKITKADGSEVWFGGGGGIAAG
jgi:Family of unknown function (DUF6152)